MKLVGQAAGLPELTSFIGIEEAQPEGTPMMAELSFSADSSTIQSLAAQLDKACLEHGVTPWPGASNIVYADQSTLRICWQKGIAWLGWILALVLPMILFPLVGALLWAFLPEPIKDIITSVFNVGIIMVAIYGLSKVTKMVTKEAA
jgi:hypothetical protein